MSEQKYEIEHNPEHHRYVITVDGKQAGFANYYEDGGVRDFNHTVIDPAFRGRGLSAPLIQAALNDTRKSGKKIIPSCSAVEHFVQKNEGYKDLLK
ncbi:GNAT family N-acetyltransferase [Corynebacterium tuscaniense]|uniref:GNAT family N-acetyltransferase n=1 Tax=Corynebacterium tuscaniense TaxID=302449 RepID=UPI00050E3CD6|nr:GNAT family N-acetyltransferase [Corynebacterium tuscaniense]KAA8730766.1 N-acetyltransferase [Corynebacterium tuscaniense]KGF20152.1 acetyltransferase [Corynebacterium tuscaniense DNF00037]